ncbi:MAG: hypothetical protein JSV82_07225 [Planctomycetota bacterium]|nr:MAG: hypothetical protein JSV82_07225 [Planctomycetota bacterium]
MNTKKKIERYLHNAPKPPAPDGLLDRLKEDASTTEVETQSWGLRRWFAPPGGAVSPRRIAIAAAIVIMIMLPLSYGAVRVIKYCITEVTFEYPEDNITFGVSSTFEGNGKEDVRETLEEFRKLYNEGKAEEVKPGVWVVTLSSGEKFALAGDNPEWAGLLETEEVQELMKEQFDEILELRKAGDFEKIYKPEHDFEIDGVKYRYFEAHYTLSNGKVVSVGDSEPAEDED